MKKKKKIIIIKDEQPDWKRSIIPTMLMLVVTLFFVFLAAISVIGIKLQPSDWLLIGIILLIGCCVVALFPLLFRKTFFKYPLRIYYTFVTLWVITFIASCAMILGVLLPPKSEQTGKIICAMNLKKLSNAINAYQENEGSYPTASKWGDLLVTNISFPHDAFICRSAKPAKCHYAINPYCEPNSPNDVVLLFETKGGWNQHGGPELFTGEHHKSNNGGVLFNDKQVLFINPEDINNLNWGLPEPNGP